MQDDQKSELMQAVHDKLEPLAGQLMDLGVPMANVADGFTMMALRLMATAYGRVETGIMLATMAKNIAEEEYGEDCTACKH